MTVTAKCFYILILQWVLFVGKASAFPVDMGTCIQIAENSTCPDNKYVKFYLYTRSNPYEAQLLDMVSDNITYSYFDSTHPTKIIIHGFNSDYNLFALTDIRKAYMKKGDYNVIAVDWSDLSRGSITCYPSAVNNGLYVGKCIAQFVQRIRQLSADDIHIIGFSLGAHLAGFTANNIRPYRLPRITGLDPAMPLFVTSGADGKLDSSDAYFVDIVHTNAFMQGKIEQCGHVDFYFNGGMNQPGCGYVNKDSSACSHVRAPQYFAESINSPVGFWGWPCSSYMAYLVGLCPPTTPAVLMGDQVSHRSRGYTRVETKSASPFALGQSVFIRKRSC